MSASRSTAKPDPVPARLIPPLADLKPALLIFDKDGTLIDFQAMWGSWLAELAARIERKTRLSLTPQLFSTMGFDPITRRIDPTGPLAVAPVAELHHLLIEILQAAGLSRRAGEAVVAESWHIPDPVRLAQPLADLKGLMGALFTMGIKLAVATSDDRPQTEATLHELGIAHLVEALVCADDGLPIKPAPDMIWRLCNQLHLPAAKAVMIGDNLPDLQMGRAAGVALTVGVLSGLASAAELEPYADILLPSINELLISSP